MKNMKLGAKIALGFGILIVIAGILGVVGVVEMGEVKTETTKLAQEYIPEVDVANNLMSSSSRKGSCMRITLLPSRSNYIGGLSMSPPMVLMVFCNPSNSPSQLP